MRGEFVLGGREESAGGETCPMRGRTGVGREESAGDETCPRGGGRARGESEGDLTCLTRAMINRVGCRDTRHG